MWLQLVTSLPTENAAVRQRAWRTLKSSGAAVLRDGVYLMPDTPTCRHALDEIAALVRGANGTAWVLRMEDPEQDDFKALFDRGEEYAALLREITGLTVSLASAPDTAADMQKQVRRLRKAFSTLEQIDFFPGAAKAQTHAALQGLEQLAVRILAPDEPQTVEGEIPRLAREAFQARNWATRQHPWIDRLASAWLIKRFIDPAARFVWLKQPADCPHDAVGFDFDGATFTHVGNRVTFEVLMASFGLERSALIRIGALVHYLDVGGVQPPEAAGVESILAGMRNRTASDDALLAGSDAVFDALFDNFEANERGRSN